MPSPRPRLTYDDDPMLAVAIVQLSGRRCSRCESLDDVPLTLPAPHPRLALPLSCPRRDNNYGDTTVGTESGVSAATQGYTCAVA